MSEITPNDLPPINEIDEFTTRIPELQTDTDVLAGTGGPANFQAQALANRTKYLKHILDLVGQELTGISQAVATAQQSADTAKQGADASMKKSANGADIVNPAAFRANIGLSNAMLRGEFGWGGKAVNIPGGVNILNYFSSPQQSGTYSATLSGITGGPVGPAGADSGKYEWILGLDGIYGTLRFTSYNRPYYTATNILINGAWEGWVVEWNSLNLPNPINAGLTTRIPSRVIEITDNSNPNADYAIEYGAMTGGLRYCYFDWHTDGSPTTDYNVRFAALPPSAVGELSTFSINAQDLDLPGMKGFVRNFRATPGFNNIGEIFNYWTTEQSMGSVLDNSNFQWRSFINVRHRGGNGYRETSGDSNAYGFVIVEDAMTQGVYELNVVKQRAGVWLNPVSLYHTGNTTADANGFLKVASPVVKLFGTGTSELNTESYGLVTERINQGVYRISGCLGLNSDLAWGGVEGGIVGPRCRNGLERLWIDYDVEQDGSIVIRTYHRMHPNAMEFARNELDGYAEGDPIDIPSDSFLSIRVQMPAREEVPYVPTVALEPAK